MIPRLAQSLIRDLDAELAKTGDMVTIARLADAPNGAQEPFYCEFIPAKVTLAQPQEVIAIGALGTIQDSTVIISPTRMVARQWPVPPRKDDRIYLLLPSGRILTGNIESVIERRVQNVAVRYELKTRS